MGTIKTEIKTFKIELECDFCKQGYMVSTGRAFTNTKSYNIHRCSHCEKELEVIDRTYPQIVYEKIKPKDYETGPA